jgi:hypothetical protein
LMAYERSTSPPSAYPIHPEIRTPEFISRQFNLGNVCSDIVRECFGKRVQKARDHDM